MVKNTLAWYKTILLVHIRQCLFLLCISKHKVDMKYIANSLVFIIISQHTQADTFNYQSHLTFANLTGRLNQILSCT
jgi:hypothetical protein